MACEMYSDSDLDAQGRMGLRVIRGESTNFVDVGQKRAQTRFQPRYQLSELLATSDYSKPQTTENREWVDAPSVGGELV